MNENQQPGQEPGIPAGNAAPTPAPQVNPVASAQTQPAAPVNPTPATGSAQGPTTQPMRQAPYASTQPFGSYGAQPQASQPTQPQVPYGTQPQAAYTQPRATYGQPAGNPYATPTQPYGAAPQQPHVQPKPAPRPKKERKPRKPLGQGAKTFLCGFAGALLACLLVFGASGLFGSKGTTTVNLGGEGGTQITVDNDNATLAEVVAAKCTPSVVSIDTYVKQSSSSRGPWGSQDSTSSGSLTAYSSGSGVILSSDGYIITNYHVIESTDKVVVSVGTTEYDATVVGTDASSDLAVLKIDASDLTAIEIGSSEDLVVGEWCSAIGCSFGLGVAVSAGIVSATDCSYEDMNSESDSAIYANMIQTDAAVNPGNSGGALVDSDGKLIGITTQGATYSGDNSGVNFAIPVDYAVDIAQQIIDGKTPSHSQMGVTLTTINANTAAYYDLAVSEGAYISSVSEGSGADKAGLEVGDIIVGIGNDKVDSSMDVILAIRSHKTGDTLSVTVNRDGTEKTFDVTLGSDS